MKTIIQLSAITILLFSLTGCPFMDCDCPEPISPLITQYQLDKKIVEINTTNVSTGLESVFKQELTDSTNRAHFCQTFVDYARFYNDKSGYFFIETLEDAWVVAHINHDLIGTSLIDIQDENGTYFIEEMVRTVAYSGYGFVEYYRKNPSTEVIEKKMSFVTSLPSAQWFIGAGFYGDPPDYYYDYYEANGLIVLEATRTMAEGIGGILKEIYTENTFGIEFCQTFVDHIRFFDDGSGYFFIVDLDGMCIAQGARPEDEGTNIKDLQDTQGTYFIQEMISVVNESGSGVVEYFWNNPVTGENAIKSTFVMRIPDTDYFIGAGYYIY